MPNLHIQIANKTATYTLRDGAVVCDNTDYTAVFTFDEEWAAETTRVARFVWNGRHHDVDIAADGTCAVPRITGAKVLHVGVYAGELRTTTSAEIPCEASILSKPTEPGEEYAAGYVEEIRAAVRHTDEVAKATEEMLGDASSTLSRVEKEVQNLRQAIAPEFFQTDSGVAYQKSVPDNALPFAEVEEVGGMTYAQDGILKHTDVVALEIEGRNILDLTPALNASLKDNGDGTYTLTKTANSRFTAFFPLYIPKGQQVFCYLEIVDTNIDGLTRIPFQLFDADRADNKASIGLATGGTAFAPTAETFFAKAYLQANDAVGAYVTFRKPMIHYQEAGQAALPFAPYIGKRSWLLPDEVRALPDWGVGINATAHNRLVWNPENGVKQYRQEVGVVDMGDLTYSMRISNGRNIFGTASLRQTIRGFVAGDAPFPAVATGYRAVRVADTWVDGDMAYGNATVGYTSIEFVNNAYTTAEDFKAAMRGRLLVYALATPIVTDLPDLPDDNFIEVEGGGTITAANQYGLAVPTAITYQLKEA
jgi:hypothetical protein